MDGYRMIGGGGIKREGARKVKIKDGGNPRLMSRTSIRLILEKATYSHRL